MAYSGLDKRAKSHKTFVLIRCHSSDILAIALSHDHKICPLMSKQPQNQHGLRSYVTSTVS